MSIAETSMNAERSGHEKLRPACLVLHGLGGGSYELEPLTESLRDHGYTVHAPVLPGHEGPGPTMSASTWQEWSQCAEQAFDTLAAEGRPVAVVGFSTGATLALELASRKAVDRMVLLAPFLAIRYSGLIPLRPSSYLRPLAKLWPNLPRRPPAARDAKMRRWAADRSSFQTFNVYAALSALDLIDTIKPRVPSITAPALIIQGRLDTVVEPGGASWLHQNLGSTNKTLMMLPRSDHLVALDLERERVIAATLEFLDRDIRPIG